MEELFNIGVMDEEIKEMIHMCPSIMDLSSEEVIRKINLLKGINCSERHIRNIIISNPYYLDRIDEDIIKLIKKLQELKFSTIYLLLETNPFILNLDSYEIDNYINDRISNNEILEDIVDDMESRPYLFDEI